MTETQVFTATSVVTLDQAGAMETALEMIADEEGILPPLLTYYEIEGGKKWQLDIYFEGEIDEYLLAKIKERSLCHDVEFSLLDVEQKDWVSESQKGLAPVIAGRFFVYGSHDADKVPADKIPLLVDASQAFGTGHHETTSGCLELIDGLYGRVSPTHMLDVGTGTGLLALAAQRLWPDAKTVASDIDPIAIEVTARTLSDNQEAHVAPGMAGITTVVAAGLDAGVIADNGPYDLVMANILAAPLIALATEIAGATKAGGHIILSGLLVDQKEQVMAAYTAAGCRLLTSNEKGDWAALLLTRD